MKYKNSKLFSFLYLILIVVGFENCRIYKKREVSDSIKIQWYLDQNLSAITPHYELFKDSLGNNYKTSTSTLSPKFNYFVHYKGRIIGLSNVRIDSLLNIMVFSKYTLLPDRIQMDYYEKIKEGNYKLRKRSNLARKAIRQVHFFLNDQSFLNENILLEHKMFYTKDISKIEVLKSAHGLNFIKSVSITFMSLIIWGTGILIYSGYI